MAIIISLVIAEKCRRRQSIIRAYKKESVTLKLNPRFQFRAFRNSVHAHCARTITVIFVVVRASDYSAICGK